jgi:hypothetical protein
LYFVAVDGQAVVESKSGIWLFWILYTQLNSLAADEQVIILELKSGTWLPWAPWNCGSGAPSCYLGSQVENLAVLDASYLVVAEVQLVFLVGTFGSGGEIVVDVLDH